MRQDTGSVLPALNPLRQSRSHEGARFDSVVMGMLAAEYAQRSEGESTETHTV